tara:strand:- start:28 stop:195 length:168 start_codon:yes stop_codon:yes gene_type:complete
MGNCIWSDDTIVSDYDIDYMIYVDGLAREPPPPLDIIFEGFLYDHNIVSDPIPIR